MKKDKYTLIKEIKQEYTYQEHYEIPVNEMDEIVRDTFENDENVRYIRIIYKIEDSEGKERFVSDVLTKPGFERIESYGETISDKMEEKLSFAEGYDEYEVLESFMNVIYDI